MTSKTVLALMFVIAVAGAVPAQPAEATSSDVNTWTPPWAAYWPWYWQWSPCGNVGSICLDCSSKLICMKAGSRVETCTDPKMPYCNLGKCSATPSEDCASPGF